VMAVLCIVQFSLAVKLVHSPFRPLRS
jgi:hypothetical protein